jgi:hypothetical protein
MLLYITLYRLQTIRIVLYLYIVVHANRYTAQHGHHFVLLIFDLLLCKFTLIMQQATVTLYHWRSIRLYHCSSIASNSTTELRHLPTLCYCVMCTL